MTTASTTTNTSPTNGGDLPEAPFIADDFLDRYNDAKIAADRAKIALEEAKAKHLTPHTVAKRDADERLTELRAEAMAHLREGESIKSARGTLTMGESKQQTKITVDTAALIEHLKEVDPKMLEMFTTREVTTKPPTLTVRVAN